MKIIWNKVTWYSKFLAVIIGLAAIALGIYFTTDLQGIVRSIINAPQVHSTNTSSDLKTYKNDQYGFEISYPANLEASIPSGTEWRYMIKTGTGGVAVSLPDPSDMGFNTKLGHYIYDPKSNMWISADSNQKESLCRIQEVLGSENALTYAYKVDSNMMPNAYPRTFIVVTNLPNLAFGINAFCGEEGCDQAELDIQNKIVKSFATIGDVKSVACSE